MHSVMLTLENVILNLVQNLLRGSPEIVDPDPEISLIFIGPRFRMTLLDSGHG